MKRSGPFCAALALSLSTHLAYAQQPPAQGFSQATPQAAPGSIDEAVYLRSGGMLRGSILEIVPNDHVSIVLPNGQMAIVQWSEITRIEKKAPSQIPAPAPLSTAVPPPAPVQLATALVHIESESPVTLETGEGKSWSLVCSAPCDRALPLGPSYRITGPGIRNSGPFSLAARPGGSVVLQVDTASKGGFVGGIVLVSTGAVAVVTGLVLVLVGAIASDTHSSCTSDCTPSAALASSFTEAGLITLISGGIATAGGIALLATNGSTRVYQQPASAPQPARAAVFRAPEPFAASPPQLMIPLFTF
jgi:hypothetical protein